MQPGTTRPGKLKKINKNGARQQRNRPRRRIAGRDCDEVLGYRGGERLSDGGGGMAQGCLP
jgi:hypothetical protein